MSGNEPKPGSPERLQRVTKTRARIRGGQVAVTVTVIYEPWCCLEGHELADGVKAVTEALEAARVGGEL